MTAPATLLPSTTDPASLYRVRDALYTVDMLTVGIVHLDVFSLLAGGPRSAADLCKALAVAERPADVMLTLFCALNLLSRRDGKLELTPLSREHLVNGSPWNMSAYFESFKDRPVCQDLLRVLKTGKPASWASDKSLGDWHKSMEDEAFADKFTAAMDCRGAYLGPRLAEAVSLRGNTRLLDVGGGSGVYACALVSRNPQLRAAVLEKPPVDRVARRWIERRGFSDRVGVVASDMLTASLPHGYDVHLYSNVIHDWDTPQVKILLARSHEALPPGGRILIHDAHLNREKTGPQEVAEYSVLLMHATEGRCYSVGEIEALLEEVGFMDVEQLPTAASRSVISARK